MFSQKNWSKFRMTPFPLFWHGKPNMMQNGVCCNNATAPHLLLISMYHRNILEPVISFPSCQLTMIKKYAYQIHLKKSNHQTCNCSAGILCTIAGWIWQSRSNWQHYFLYLFVHGQTIRLKRGRRYNLQKKTNKQI